MTEAINPALTGKHAENAALWAASDWADVAIFIGPHAERFEPVWAKLREDTMAKGAAFKHSWCWPALLVGFAWYFYRRMWLAGAILLVLPLLIGWFVPFNGAGIGLAVATAMLSKSVYVQHAVARIAKIRAAGGSEQEIAAAGGVSIPGAVIGAIIVIVFGSAVIWGIANGVPLRD